MKKSATALLFGILCSVSAPAYAASNPFADVPADHWSRDVVSQLAADGIITGYPDGSFQGDRAITRFEMAQMIARAMAHRDALSLADQAMLDKLSLEYATELHNLGVRVDNLERMADSVKFSGYFYLREQSQTIKNKDTGTKTTTSVNRAFLDAILTAKTNDHWDVVMETNTVQDLNKDTDGDTTLVGAYAHGTYPNLDLKLGKIDTYSGDGGLVLHWPLSGAQITFGKTFKTTLTAARISGPASLRSLNSGETFSYQSVEFAYPTSKATKLGGGVYCLRDKAFQASRGTEAPYIYSFGFQTRFHPLWRLTGYVQKSSSDTSFNQKVKDLGYYAALEYRGVKLNVPHSWGLYTKYASIPELTQISMDVGHFRGYRGVEIGAFYMAAKNVRTHLRYYYGKNVENSNITKSLVRGEVRVFF